MALRLTDEQPSLNARQYEKKSQPLNDFQQICLDHNHQLWQGRLPEKLLESMDFDALWRLHPSGFSRLKMYGRETDAPRWSQAYAQDYVFSGNISKALPLPEPVRLLMNWARTSIDKNLNGALLNWYDAESGHYIGRHRDNPRGLLHDAPIVTISFGEERVFRLRPWLQKDRKVAQQHDTGNRVLLDLAVSHGSVIILPYHSNRAWTHEVPHYRHYQSKRISVTLRAFASPGQKNQGLVKNSQ